MAKTTVAASAATSARSGGSGIREIMELAMGREDIARLEVGEPDSPCAMHIAEAGVRACIAPVGYVQGAGVPELRVAIAKSLTRRYGSEVDPARIIVTHGAAQGIALAFSLLLRAGDSILVPDPAWPNYVNVARELGARPLAYSLRAENGWLPDVDTLFALADDRTRVLVLNSPGNPTGAVMPRALVAEIVARARSRGIMVVSDEVYDELIYEGRSAGAAFLEPDAVIAAFSFSKTYAMTGWRVGYLLVPPEMSTRFAYAQEATTSCLSPIVQVGALSALEGPQGAVSEMRDEYRARRDLLVAQLDAAGIRIEPPAGAFYALLPVPGGRDARDAALELIDHGVAMAPGTAFGAVAADRLRVSLASSRETLRIGLERYLAWYGAK
ncbi:pyridoxal phosphate-dependent aminotransferase [Microbacterium sp. ASV49]|uniref:Aminotransferase n=1 Tax=Microbacterium candidum TaxID=3041922 RepID=A0ABT7MW54_9MICO|nr:pyridoxal phosphate-dependent aminotransferase [Microbacterium sp. ASV49]MDL9978684.1 pyridoxal phosphate-dependent aminotransferase [Microbacterium sp. ASV49]